MTIQSFEIDYEGVKETIEYEDDLTFGELEAILNQCLDLSDVTKPKVDLPQYRQSILLKTIRKAPFEAGSLPVLRNLRTSVVNQVLKGVLKDYPLVTFLEGWVRTFVGNEDLSISEVSTTSSPKSSAGIKKKSTIKNSHT
jgi:hypothetical protein